MRNKKGQVTIFIIIAILIVVGVVVYFIWVEPSSSNISSSENPNNFIDNCVEDEVELSIEKILVGGGRIIPDFYELYQSEKYNYLCYQRNYYLPCVNHYPMLKATIEEEIKQDADDGVRECFSDLKEELEAKKYVVSGGTLDWGVVLVPGAVEININKNLEISKEGSQSYSSFDTKVLSSLYGLVSTTRRIINDESRNCNFDYTTFVLLYPDYEINRFIYDGSKIYNIINVKTRENFMFAIRGCVLPPQL